MENTMADAFRAGQQHSVEEQAAQVAAALADLEARGFHKVEGPIMQLAQTRSKPGRRDDLLRVLKNFQAHVQREDSTLFFGFFPDLEDPDLVHSVQVYENWEGLRHHMVQHHYFQYLDAILEASDPGEITYHYASNLFMHRGKGRNA